MTDTTITINLAQPTELEFEMTTNGLHKDSDIPTVRFMLIDSEKGISYTFPCSKQGKKKWVVHFPQLNVDIEHDHTFCIECIIDGHHFIPAEGIVNLIDKPIAKVSNKPKEKIIKVKNVEDVKEGAEAANITGQYAPTNDLLKPEKKPKDSSAKIPKTEPYDELIDIDNIGDFAPGRGGKQYAQSNKVEFEDPRTLVDKILSQNKNTGLADIERKPGKGKLFTRDADGRPIVKGLETEEQKEQIAALNQKIRDVLKN